MNQVIKNHFKKIESQNLKEFLSQAFHLKFIDESEFKLINSKLYDIYKQTPWIAKLGFFILAILGIITALGSYASMLAIMNLLDSDSFYRIHCLIISIGLAFSYYVVIIKNNNFNSGIDNAILYSFICFFLYSILGNYLFNFQSFFYLICFSLVLFFLVISYLVADRLLLLVCLCLMGAISYQSFQDFSASHQYCIFYYFRVGLCTSIFLLVKFVERNNQSLAHIFWFEFLKITTIIALCLASSVYLNKFYFEQIASERPFGNIDHIAVMVAKVMTLFIPALLIYFGYKEKDKLQMFTAWIMFNIGLAAIIYLLIEIPSVVGIIMGSFLLLSYFLVRFLIQNNKVSLTFIEEPSAISFDKLLTIVQISNPIQTNNPTISNSEYKGGNYGGGGSGGDF